MAKFDDVTYKYNRWAIKQFRIEAVWITCWRVILVFEDIKNFGIDPDFGIYPNLVYVW